MARKSKTSKAKTAPDATETAPAPGPAVPHTATADTEPPSAGEPEPSQVDAPEGLAEDEDKAKGLDAKVEGDERATAQAPSEFVVYDYPDPRDAVYDACLAEAVKQRGASARESMMFADAVCDSVHLLDANAFFMKGYTDTPALVDLRHKQDYVYPGNARKVRTVDRDHRVPFMRDPATVDAIVIHQAAVEFGVSKRAIRLYGDAEAARAHRALDVACHALAFRNGTFVAAHDLRVLVNHAGRLNERSLGLEIEGRYPGLMDDPDTLAREDLLTTWGGPPSTLTQTTVSTACAAIKWLVEEGKRYGMEIKHILAHRQSSDNRRSDPGQEIWQRVVLDYACNELGLTVPEKTWTQGRPIPREWDNENGEGSY